MASEEDNINELNEPSQVYEDNAVESSEKRKAIEQITFANGLNFEEKKSNY